MDKLPAPLLWTVKAKYLAAFGGGVEPEEGMVRVSKSPATHGIVEVAINKLTRGTKGPPRDCKQCCSVNQMDTFWKLEIPAKKIRAKPMIVSFVVTHTCQFCTSNLLSRTVQPQ